MKNTLVINKQLIFKLLIIIFLLSAPWFNGIFSESMNPKNLIQEDMSFYEVNPCKVSLLEFLINDPLAIFQDHYHFRYNNYSSISCFGKISGATLINNEFYISIGTNSFLNLVLQFTVWTLLISLIKKDNEISIKSSLIYVSSFLTAFVFTLLIFSEKRFYSQQFYLVDMDENYSYIYILTILFLLICNLSEVIIKRTHSLSNYLPYSYFLLGVFSGFNLNIYSIIVVNFGFFSFFKKRFNIKLNSLLLFTSFYWISNANNRFSFEPDKLRGFTSTSYEFITVVTSSLFMILFINGLIYFFYMSKSFFRFNLFFKNMCRSGVLILTLGIIGSNFPIVNFLNYYYFGQQKYGITLNNPFSFDEYGVKIPWRGFYPSAESIGEFYGLILLFGIIYFLKNRNDINKLDFFYILYIVLGLYFTNNRSVMILVMFIFLFYFKDRILNSKLQISIVLLLSSILFISVFGIQNLSYPYSFTSGYLYELANNYSYGYQESNGLIYVNQTYENDGFGKSVFAFISFIAFYLNRSQIWAYYLGRYNPNFGDLMIGTGPYNFAKHYAEINLLPETLLLPHSTVLSYLVFFGLIGVLGLLIYVIYKIIINKSIINYFGYSLIIFIVLNIIKNDSMLYPSGLILYTLLLYQVFNEERENIFTNKI